MTLLAVVVVAGCSSGHRVNTGPFGDGGNGGENCVPFSHPGQLVTEGFNEVTDTWRGTVAVISKISLVRPHGLRLLRTYAVRLHNHPSYGDMPGLPPHDDGFQYPWTARNHPNAIGARVPYTGTNANQTDLLLVLRTSGSKPRDKGINIWYHVGTQQFHQRTQWGVVFTTKPGHC